MSNRPNLSGSDPGVLRTLKAGLPVFRPESYDNFYGNGTRDDSLAVQSIMTDLRAAGGGVIELSNYTLRVQPGIIGALPIYSTIRGKGRYQSIVKWYGQNQSGTYLIDLSGTIASNNSFVMNGYHTLEHFTIDGGGSGGGSYLLRSYYNVGSVFISMRGNSADQGFLDAVQMWDSRWFSPKGETCGATAASVAMWFRNSATATSGTFGFGPDNSNQNFIWGGHFESHYGAALKIERGPGNTQPPNGFYVDNFKAESAFTQTSAQIILGTGVTGCVLRNLYGAVDPSATGSTTQVNIIEDNSSGGCVIGPMFLTSSKNAGNTASMVNAPYLSNASGATMVGPIYFSGNGLDVPASNAVIKYTGSVKPTLVGNIESYPQIPVTTGMSTALTATASLGVQDRTVLADATNAGFTLTLPSAAMCVGHDLTITKVDYSTNLVSIVPYGADVISGIDGNTPVQLQSWHSAVTLRPDPSAKITGWTVIAQVGTAILAPQRIVSTGPQLILETANGDATEELKFTVAGEAASIQSIHPGVAYTQLNLQNEGGNMTIGVPNAASDSAAASAGVPVGGVYWLNGVTLTKRAA